MATPRRKRRHYDLDLEEGKEWGNGRWVGERKEEKWEEDLTSEQKFWLRSNWWQLSVPVKELYNSVNISRNMDNKNKDKSSSVLTHDVESLSYVGVICRRSVNRSATSDVDKHAARSVTIISITIVIVCFICNVSAVTSHLIYSLEVRRYILLMRLLKLNDRLIGKKLINRKFRPFRAFLRICVFLVHYYAL